MVYVIQVMLTACEQDQDGSVLILHLVGFYYKNISRCAVLSECQMRYGCVCIPVIVNVKNAT